ncbi:2-dehydropantoate 2-reductase [Halobacillus halophilus]|uniref:2-dehydropantoate 2-reductase n=1 Tax=Halobacillus halophilus TaxID=1570 RepID=UPI001CD7FE9F|nr:2-dehydropantoate 2-reductase [Halobacillus halophilus]MCA1012989.1 2-dehydropantoate 2-reductase [Halobacillus halophilus]
MEIGIIGGGSVGLLTAAYLGRNHEVHLYVRRERQRNHIESEGVQCDGLGESTQVRAHTIEEGVQNHSLLIIAVKQKDIYPLLDMNLPSDVPFLFLQNGMGHLERIKELHNSCWLGVVEHGALRVDDSHVKHTGKGKINIASLPLQEAGLQQMVKALHTEEFPVVFREDYEDMLASKLLINAVINPLTGLFRVKNGDICTNHYLRSLAWSLCREACMVLGRSVDQEWERILSIAQLTSENQSSMLKDLESGRKTEIEAINEYLIKRSAHPLPNHQFVVDAVHALEVINEGRQAER